MERAIFGAAAALLGAAFSSPTLAQNAEDRSVIVVQTPLLHPAAGLMNEHMHDGGEVMIGLRFQRVHSGGRNRSGTDPIDDSAILAAGYTSRVESMNMDMVMLDLMYAPSDDLTLMVMPHYMWHRMEMVGIDPMAGMGGGHSGHGVHGGHGTTIGFGETHAHGTDGFGDTLVSAASRLVRQPGLGAHATLGVWVPTGDVDRTNPDGTFVHYGMQPGGGTWDLEPSLTVRGEAGAIGWGGQAAYRVPLESANESGFRFGDRFRATGWLSYLLTADLGATARLEFAHQGKIEGHYSGPHNHSAPPDRQENYGGDIVRAGLGLNFLLPLGGADRPQLGAEFTVPLHQDLNGIQAPEEGGFSLSISREF